MISTAFAENISELLQRNIRSLRKRMNFSQEELAKKVGLNRGNIASYENGSAEPKICNLLKFANIFGVSIIDLTQKDLSEEEAFKSACLNYQKSARLQEEMLSKFVDHACEVEAFLKSILTCHRFKERNVDTIPEEMKFAFYNFEQLFDASHALLKNYKMLLEYVNGKENPDQGKNVEGI